jgi:hypothetical protein
MNKNLIWSNLLKNRCPKCNRNLWYDGSEPMIICPSYTCGFMIDQAKMQQFTMELAGRKLEWSAEMEGQERPDMNSGYLNI